MKEKLKISYLEYLPESVILDFRNASEFEVEVHKRKSSIQNNIEWLALAFVAVYVTKPFLEGFFKKAGEDTYKVFIKNLSILIKNVQAFFRNQFTIKDKDKKKQILHFSFLVRLPLAEVNLRFMYENNLKENQIIEQIMKMLVFCSFENLNHIDQTLKNYKDKNSNIYTTIFSRYLEGKEQWEIFDPFEEIRKEIKTKKENK